MMALSAIHILPWPVEQRGNSALSNHVLACRAIPAFRWMGLLTKVDRSVRGECILGCSLLSNVVVFGISWFFHEISLSNRAANSLSKALPPWPISIPVAEKMSDWFSVVVRWPLTPTTP